MIREMQPHDFAAVARVLSTVSHTPITAEDKAFFLSDWQPQYPALHLVAEGAGGSVLGYGTAYMGSWLKAGRMSVNIVIDPAWRGRGIGEALWSDLLAFAGRSGAAVLSCQVADDDPAGRCWAERRGFAIRHHIFDSALDLAAFDFTPFAGHVARLEARGYRFVPFSELQTPTTERQLHEFYHKLLLQMPNGPDLAVAAFTDWRDYVLGTKGWPEVSPIVVDAAGRWVGCHFMRRLAPDLAHVVFLGVEQECRGQGLALAMKLRVMELMRGAGIARVTTNNHSLNAPMLWVNEKLGFRRLPGYYVLFREL